MNEFNSVKSPPPDIHQERVLTTSPRSHRSPSQDPILILDIKLDKNNPLKIIINEGDIPEQVVEKFCKETPLDAKKKNKLLKVI